MLLALLLLELCCRLLPVSTATYTGYHVAPNILTYPPHHRFTIASGWDLKNAHHHQANNYGFLADHDFAFNPQAIGLVGDSFVEANMLPPHDRLAAQLEKALGGQTVFALGGPGSSLLDYGERIEFAHQTFGINQFVVVLERGDIRQARCGSGHNHGPCFDPHSRSSRLLHQPAADWKKRLIRESALAQYVFSQLKVDPAKFWKQSASTSDSQGKATSVPDIDDSANEEMLISRLFFDRLESIQPPPHVLFVTDADRKNLMNESSTAPDPLKQFKELAHRKAYAVIELDEPFRHFLHQGKLILEVGPADSHWNAAAVQVVTKQIATQLKPR
ncbi:MAG: hypothetical protein D3M94_11625 [Rhodocyclales bacterium GT-UBC]|nr:MAG: hypothetical protein D3M94_11625 [Rhodocyclales bacterium GT-UBC]